MEFAASERRWRPKGRSDPASSLRRLNLVEPACEPVVIQ
jgi:hypothetical protein